MQERASAPPPRPPAPTRPEADAGGAPRPRKIVSGGQTGVDRAALDVAAELGLEHGGWCPRGRRAEDGRIPARYALRETEDARYAVRTERNVLDSDATLVLNEGPLAGGTALTVEFARRHGRPHFVVDLSEPDPGALRGWLEEVRPRVLNVAGPRESKRPGVGERAAAFLRELWAGAAATLPQGAGSAARGTRGRGEGGAAS